MQLTKGELWATSIMGALLLVGHLLDKAEKKEMEATEIQVSKNFEKPPANTRALDFNTGKWITYETVEYYPAQQQGTIKENSGEILSDEEIRILREKQSFKPGGSYIYTPGRIVKSHKELQDEQIEKYIEEHGEEIYENLEDKYGN